MNESERSYEERKIIPIYQSVTSARMTRRLEKKFELLQKHLYNQTPEDIRAVVTREEDYTEITLQDDSTCAIAIRSQGKDGVVRDITVSPIGCVGGLELTIKSEKYQIYGL